MNKLLNERIIFVTKQLFLTTFRIEIEAGIPYLIEADSDNGWDTSGVISVTGSYSGLIAVRFKKALPEAMLHAAQLNNLHMGMLESLINDMVGELTNVITGNTFSDDSIGEIFLSIPVTIQGRNHIISWSRDPRITVIPFHIGEDSFAVEIEIRKIT